MTCAVFIHVDRGILMTFGSGANGCLGHGDNVDIAQVWFTRSDERLVCVIAPLTR